MSVGVPTIQCSKCGRALLDTPENREGHKYSPEQRMRDIQYLESLADRLEGPTPSAGMADGASLRFIAARMRGG